LAGKEPDKNVEKEDHKTRNACIEKSFVIYDPNNPPYERQQLCKYLLELPELNEKDGLKID
jgi:hypothetical protein